ncbi:Fc.00g055750.m01.CDS01 [Cosmosporella sp. VM-42]
MASFRKLDADAILTDPDLGSAYHSMHELGKEFAILGLIESAKTLISLLLSEYSSEWQHRQIRALKFAFAEAGQWPDQIPPEERTDKELAKVIQEVAPDSGNDRDAVNDDPSELGVLLMVAKNCDASTGGAAMERSKSLVDALKALGLISSTIHANQAIEYLTQYRENWRLLATGALARNINVEISALALKLDVLLLDDYKEF